MRMIVIGVMCAMVMACTDEQNVGNTYTLRSARWTVSIPLLDGYGFVGANDVAIDPSGDVLAAGAFEGTADFGGGPVTTAYEIPAYWLGKRSGSDGSYLWTAVLGGDSDANLNVTGLRVDANGDAIVAGSFSGTQPIGDRSISSPGGEDVYVAKFSPEGHVVWIRELGGGMLDANPAGLAVGADGRIYLSSEFQGAVQFPDRTAQSTGGPSYFLAAFEPDGTLRWGRQYPVTGRLDVASDGSVILVGALDKSTTFAGVSLDLSKDPAQFAASITADGDVTWVHPFGQAGVPYVHPLLALDDHDRIATTTRIGDSGLTNGTDEALLDPSGKPLWTASPVSGHTYEMAIATNGHAVLTGGRLNDWTVDLGDGPQVGSMYLAARDATGNLVDSKVFGDPGSASNGFASLAMSKDGAVAFTATISGPVDFGSGTVPGPPRGEDVTTVIGLFAPAP